MLNSDARSYVSSSAPRNSRPAPMTEAELMAYYPARVEEPTRAIVFTPAPTDWWL